MTDITVTSTSPADLTGANGEVRSPYTFVRTPGYNYTNTTDTLKFGTGFSVDSNGNVTAASVSTGGPGTNITVSPSGDPTGAADLAALNAAVAALPAVGGHIYLGSGTFYLVPGQFVINVAKPVYIIGYGTYISAVAGTAGDVIRWYDSSALGRTYEGGGLLGVTVDGTNATGASNGVHVGDIFRFHCDFAAQNFAGGYGTWFDNQYLYTEQLNGQVYGQNCLANIVFDNSTGVATSASATGSFSRCGLAMYVNNGGAGDGVVIQNGAFLYDMPGSCGIFGNFASSTIAQYAVLKITGSNVLNGYSAISIGSLTIGCELSDTIHTVPMTIKYGSSSNHISGVSGVFDFSGNLSFTASNALGTFSVAGFVFGDSTLSALANQYPAQITPKNGINLGAYASAVAVTTGSTISPGTHAYLPVSAAAPCTGLILGGGNYDGQMLVVANTSTTNSLTFAAAGTSNVSGGVANVIPASGQCVFFWDNGTSLWYSSLDAALASPAFTGTPTVPTATGGTSNTQAASTAFVASNFAKLAGATFTGLITSNAGTKSSGSAPVITPALTNGAAAQLSDTTRDYIVYFTVGTAGTGMTIAIGPTSTPANTIVSSSVAASGQMYCFRVPAGWYVKWADTTGTLANQIAIGC